MDKHTVKITLKSPFAPFLERMTNGALQILNKKAVDAGGADYAHKPVGTGPYLLKSYTKGQGATFVKNPTYWQAGQPYVDQNAGAEIHVFPDTSHCSHLEKPEEVRAVVAAFLARHDATARV